MPEEPAPLAVWCFDRQAGALTQTAKGMEFAYAADWVADEMPPLSQSLPLDGRFDAAAAVAFFGGLLPEGEPRRHLARLLGVSESNEYSMLAMIALTGYRNGAVSGWVVRFAEATSRACAAAERLADAIAHRQAAWLEALGQPRRDAVVRQLVGVLPEQPVIDVAVAQRLTGKSHVAIGRAFQQLEDAGIINRLNERKWGRVWECDALLSLVDSFEKGVQTDLT
jgi:HipA-like protein